MFGADGRTVVTVGDDGIARLWDCASGMELHRFDRHPEVVSASSGANGRTILTAGDDGTARLWDADSGAELHRLGGHVGSVISAEFSPDGYAILTASHDGTARLWDSATGELIYALRPFPDAWVRLDAARRVVAGAGKLWKYVYGLAVDPDGTCRVVNPWPVVDDSDPEP